MLIGLIVGSIAAYFGGWIDELLMRLTDIFLSIPFLVAAMVLTTILGRGLDKVMIALIAFGWMDIAGSIRGSILCHQRRDICYGSQSFRSKRFSYHFSFIYYPIPFSQCLVQASMNHRFNGSDCAALSFLGVGAPLGYADWGQMVSFARKWILVSPGKAGEYGMRYFFPGIFYSFICPFPGI
jgi:peptide/nickel transport system permease protein